MANVLNGNTFYVDSASSGAGSYIAEKDVQLLAIMFTSATAGHTIELADLKQLSSGATAAAGSDKLKLSVDATNQVVSVRLADTPIRFPNGIWIKSISSGAVATLVLKLKS